ncbi:UNVERIFIED_CONTAM: Zinc finger CCCH domain-containing protein 64 [Sesamum radiatum]|uniref:Zinc finger CCCH domain-containing protein 64 n=1 Tax=Sesamum radiatum TaxID=300843 RepID=A0AAW2L9K6_SESRA
MAYSFPSLDFTNEWPTGVTNRAAASGVPPGMSDPSIGDSTISELVAEIKPRYHIAGGMGVYYDREPYANVGAVHVTRFIALAPVGNKHKQKFIHALSPTPASKMSSAELCTKPPNTTSFPYSFAEETGSGNGAIKRSGDSVSDTQYWRYDVSRKGRSMVMEKVVGCALNLYLQGLVQEARSVISGMMQMQGNNPLGVSKECWFCLSSPSVESHLITSVGEYCYCALAKGPLVQDHVLIIPIEHLPNTLSLPPECEKDLYRLQSSLQAYFKRQGKEVVFFEWVSKRGTHANLQAVPIPSSRASSVEHIFNLAAKKLGFTFSTVKSDNSLDGRKVLGMHLDRNQSLFYVEVPGGTILSHVVDENEKFPVQFGREVLAGLLNSADKADWRNCQLSKEEETIMADDFKSRFTEYDPNS